MQFSDDYSKNIRTEFNIKKIKNNIFQIIVTNSKNNTSSLRKENIPEQMDFQIDIENRTIFINTQKIGTYSLLQQNERTKSSSKQPIRYKSLSKNVNNTSALQICNNGVVKKLAFASKYVLSWIIYVLKTIITTIYTIFNVGPHSIFLWGFVMCLIPGMYPFVEITTINIVSWSLYFFKNTNQIVTTITSTITFYFSLLEQIFGYKFLYVPKYISNFISNSYNFMLNLEHLLTPNKSLLSVLVKISNNAELPLLQKFIDWLKNPNLYISSKYIIRMSN